MHALRKLLAESIAMTSSRTFRYSTIGLAVVFLAAVLVTFCCSFLGWRSSMQRAAVALASGVANESERPEPLTLVEAVEEWLDFERWKIARVTGLEFIAPEPEKVIASLIAEIFREYPDEVAEPDIEWATSVLVEASRSETERLRETATRALAHLGPRVPSAISLFGELLQDADENTRIYAAYSLLRLGSENRAAYQTLIDAIEDSGDRRARGIALQALGYLGPQAHTAVDQVCRALEDKSKYHRLDAAFALASIDRPNREGLEILLEALSGRTRHLSSYAAWLLSQLGRAAEPVLPELETLLESSDARLRAAVRDCVKKIDTAKKQR